MARAFGKLPHELGHGTALSYFQTLLNSLSEPEGSPRNDSDEDGLQLVDVDAMVRKGQTRLGEET